eukprot:446484-Prymnesium_polylepis.1
MACITQSRNHAIRQSDNQTIRQSPEVWLHQPYALHRAERSQRLAHLPATGGSHAADTPPPHATPHTPHRRTAAPPHRRTAAHHTPHITRRTMHHYAAAHRRATT